MLLLASCAYAAPDLDTPHRTGARSPADAAVVIGIEEYLRLPGVPYARRDASAFYDFLVYTRGVRPENVRLLTKDVTREVIEREVRALAAATRPGGTMWVYFAGHGMASPSDRERLLLGDDASADLASFEARGVPVEALTSWAASGEGEVVLVLDACYVGAGRSGETLLAGQRFVVPAFVTPAQGLEWSAVAPNEAAGPLEAAQHGAFTYFAVGALRGWADGELDGVRDGKVTAAEAHQYVSRSLRAAQITQQTPQLVGSATETVLSSGALEPAPEPSALLRPPPGGDTDFAELAARAQAADAAHQRAAAELAQKRRQALDRAAAELRAEAQADFQEISPLLDAPGPQGKAVLEAWLARYERATVTVDGVVESIEIPELARVKAALRTGRSRPAQPAAQLPPAAGTAASLQGKTLSMFSFGRSGQRGVALEKHTGLCDIGLGAAGDCTSRLLGTHDGGDTWLTLPTLGPVHQVTGLSVEYDGSAVYAWVRETGLQVMQEDTQWSLFAPQPALLGPCGPPPDAKLEVVTGKEGRMLLFDRALELEWYFDGARWSSRGTCPGDAAQPRPPQWHEIAAVVWGWHPELSPELKRALKRKALRPHHIWTRADGSLWMLASSQLVSWDGTELLVRGPLPALTSLIDARPGEAQGPMWIAVDGQGLLHSSTGTSWSP